MKRAAVFSGGGNRGRWSIEMAWKIFQEKGVTFHAAYGDSTGSLEGVFVLLWDINQKLYHRVSEFYTNARQGDIFNVNPFKKSFIRMLFFLLGRVIRKRRTMGESKPLMSLIDRAFDLDTWERLQHSKRTFHVGVQEFNTNTQDKVYFRSDRQDFTTMKRAMWISANAPVFMSLEELDPGDGLGPREYIDGGVTEISGARQAILDGNDQVYVFLHREMIDTKLVRGKTKDLFQMIKRLFSLLFNKDFIEDIQRIKELAAAKEIDKLVLVWMPRTFGNSLLFTKDNAIKHLEMARAQDLDGDHVEYFDKFNNYGTI